MNTVFIKQTVAIVSLLFFVFIPVTTLAGGGDGGSAGTDAASSLGFAANDGFYGNNTQGTVGTSDAEAGQGPSGGGADSSAGQSANAQPMISIPTMNMPTVPMPTLTSLLGLATSLGVLSPIGNAVANAVAPGLMSQIGTSISLGSIGSTLGSIGSTFSGLAQGQPSSNNEGGSGYGSNSSSNPDNNGQSPSLAALWCKMNIALPASIQARCKNGVLTSSQQNSQASGYVNFGNFATLGAGDGQSSRPYVPPTESTSGGLLNTPLNFGGSTGDGQTTYPVTKETNTISFEAKVTNQNGGTITNWTTSSSTLKIPAGANLHFKWDARGYTQCLPFFNDNGRYALTVQNRTMNSGNTETEGYNLPEVTGTYGIECGGQKNGESGVDERTMNVLITNTAATTTYTVADIEEVVSKYIDPNTLLADDEHTLYIITLKNGRQHLVKIFGLMLSEAKEQAFRDTGYSGSIDALLEMSEE